MTSFAGGFRPQRGVCMRFLELQMGRPVRECACGGGVGAPPHSHGLKFTRKFQPMSANSPRASLE